MLAGKTKCATLKYKDGQAYYPVTCNGAKASKIRLQHTKQEYMNIAEVEVYGGQKAIKNVGLLSYRQNTEDSSRYAGSHPRKVVDGDVSGFWGHRKMHVSKVRGTASTPQTLSVDISQTTNIYLVIVHIREDGCCSKRAEGMKVYAGGVLCGTIHYQQGIFSYPIYCGGKKARVVKLVNKREYLEVAEVQIYGKGSAVPRKTGMTFGKINL